MARALGDILTELNAVYNPQKDLVNQQMATLDPLQQQETQGLEYAKRDAFDQITNQANRRGLFYSGIPVAEEQRYTGGTFLPAVANLKAKYAQQRFNLQDALNKIVSDQYKTAYGIQSDEAQREAAERAARAAAASGFIPGAGGGGAPPPPQAPQQTLRQRWQDEAKRGDWNAQVALNYAGDDGRYDGPVNSVDEYNRLKSMGITGRYYVAQRKAQGGGGGGF